MYPYSADLSYVATPEYQVLNGGLFSIDRAWNRAIYFENEDNWIREYGSYGDGSCQFKRPRSIQVLAPCNDIWYSDFYYVYIADTDNDRIDRIRYNWSSQSIQCDPAITGLGLVRPVDIDLNNGGSFYTIGEDDFPSSQNNYLWVVNSPIGTPNEIKRIAVNGELKSTSGTSGCEGEEDTFCEITAIVSGRYAFQPVPYSNGDDFYVADVGNNRIVWLLKETNGENINWWGEIPCGSGFIDLETDHFGHIWALDRDAGTVTKYTNDLFPLCVYGNTGIGEDQFNKPVSISDPVGYLGAANMYIIEDWTDSSGEQYFAIGTDVVDFAVTSTVDEYIHYVDFVLVSPSKVYVRIFDEQGDLVKTLYQSTILSGNSMLVWDGKNTAGELQPTGEYRVQIIDSATVVDGQTGEPVNVVTKEQWFHHEFYCCNADGIRGDADNNCSTGCVNVLDLNFLINYVFRLGPSPDCPAEGNVDGIGTINVLDVNYLINMIFRFGSPPPACP